MNKKHIIFLSFTFFIFGISLLLNSKIFITGAVVGVSNSSSVGSIFGIMLIFVSILILIAEETLEERLNIKSFKRKIEKLEKRKISYEEAKTGYKNQSIRELALSRKVPLDEAVKMHNDADNKVKTREWVEIYRENPRFATGKEFAERMGTSMTRWYGPQKYQGKITNKSQANKLVRGGIIGKTHEIVVPSETEYNDIPESEIPIGEKRMFKKDSVGKWFQKTAVHGRDLIGPMPNPKENYPSGESYPGARPLHRHWEIEEMYKAIKSKKK